MVKADTTGLGKTRLRSRAGVDLAFTLAAAHNLARLPRLPAGTSP